MSSQPDFIRKKFGPLRDKTLRNAIAHRISNEFPRIGGPRICDLCADMILEVVFKHMRPQRPCQTRTGTLDGRQRQRPASAIANASPIPISSPSSSTSPPPRMCNCASIVCPAPQRLLHKARRLCQQAYEQGGLLSNCDIAELLHTHDSRDRARCWPSMSAAPTRSSRDAPRSTTLEQD